MLTTAGPYLCTMELKSGSITAGTAVAGALVAAAGAGVVATARVAPAKYRALTGTAMVAAPMTPAIRGFLRKVGRFMASAPSKGVLTAVHPRQAAL